MEIIKTSGLTKFYGKARGIQGVDLAVEQGDFFGFIGPNGAGKSTTIRTLLGLIRPSSGSAEIFGKDVMKHREEILADLGYLPSEAAFYGNMRVGELLRFSAALRKKDCAREAEALCERLRLDKNRRIRELSLGNRKKAAIVCALHTGPTYVILDEPTSRLDPLYSGSFPDSGRARGGGDHNFPLFPCALRGAASLPPGGGYPGRPGHRLRPCGGPWTGKRPACGSPGHGNAAGTAGDKGCAASAGRGQLPLRRRREPASGRPCRHAPYGHKHNRA